MSVLSNVIVVLVEPESPGNVGFTARAMANFGVDKLRVVGSDPRNEDEAIMFSVHANNILQSAQIYPTLNEAISDVDIAWAATARAGGDLSVTRVVVPLEELPSPRSLPGRVALVFGRESSGLTTEEILSCDITFTIPTSSRYRSLNLSHAVAVTLYQLYLRATSEEEDIEQVAHRLASRDSREQVCEFFDEIVDAIPLKDYRKPIAKQVFRNVVGRSFLTGREVTTLTGVIRKMRNYILKCSQRD